MPEYTFKKVLLETTNEQLAPTKNKYVILKTYNKTTVTQLGICTILIEHKYNKKKCRFFVVPGNGQVLLGMPDTDALNIINMNIHSIGAENAGIVSGVQTHALCGG